jgi:hypothetical protein
MLVMFCVGGMAMAETERAARPDLAGRWVSEKPELMLDLSRCGAGWCGVEVEDGACGKTVLRVGATADSGSDTVEGRLDRAAGAQSYAVEVGFFRRETKGAVGLLMIGTSGNKFDPWRRTFPFRAKFARMGDAQCAPDPNTS